MRSVVRRLRRPDSDAVLLRRRVASLEAAVVESSVLHAPLEELVTQLERDVAACLAQRHPEQ